MSDMLGYDLLGRTGAKVNNVDTTLPLSGVTLTLYQSNWGGPPTKLDTGCRFKMLIFNVFSSHASATNGFTVDESNDGGTTWDNLFQATIAASTATKAYVKVSAPELRVRYANSASNTTTFRWSLLGDRRERSNF